MVDIYLPGDIVDNGTIDESEQSMIVGRGIEQPRESELLIAVQPGILRKASGKRWIDVFSRRYVPQKDDRVIGVITAVLSDGFRVDIGTADIAYIYFTSFEDATKRNRPNYCIGDLLYASICLCGKHLETELTCVDKEMHSRGMGLLSSTSGFLFRCSLNLVRRILSRSSQLLASIGKSIPFEITCGSNGRIWIKSAYPKETVAIVRVILDSEFLNEGDVPSFVEERLSQYKGSH